jgi:hypothetical protein
MHDEAAKEETPSSEETKSGELSNEDLDSVSGGAVNAFLNFVEIEGESKDQDHKGWVSFRRR